MTSVAAIVCENGLGHFKRMLGILDEWHRRNPQDQIHIYAEEWQVQQLHDWPKISLFDRPEVHLHPGVVHPGIRLGSPESYRSGRLVDWGKRLEHEEELLAADLVLSDNLSGVLQYRKDAILLGSFLWSDVFEAVAGTLPEVQAFIQLERSLLEHHRPPMICVADIAMPGVLERTHAVRVPWFAQDPAVVRDPQKMAGRVAILGGATGLMDTAIQDVARRLSENPEWELFLPPKLLEGSELTAQPFGFSVADYAAVDLVICRPGIGTITDCINTSTPMLTISEKGNPEMDHNSERLSQLGLARRVQRPSDLVPTILDICQPENYALMVQRLRERETSGISTAVDWLETSVLQRTS
jgi:hypothetical protein